MPAPDRKRRLTAFVVAMAVLTATPLAVVASDQFSDVPDSNVFHDDIGWLADAGITKGCNPPDNTEFCPKDEVTREQMSAFMRRFAQYVGAEDGTPAQADSAGDADTLDGADSTAYRTVVSASSCGVTAVTPDVVTSCLPSSGGFIIDQTNVQLLDVQIAAPTGGALQLSATSLAQDIIAMWFTIDETCAPINTTNPAAFLAQAVNGHIFGAGSGGSAAAHITTTVSSGDHTIRLCGQNGTGANIQVATGALTAQWTAGATVEVASSEEAGSPIEIPLLTP